MNVRKGGWGVTAAGDVRVCVCNVMHSPANDGVRESNIEFHNDDSDFSSSLFNFNWAENITN